MNKLNLVLGLVVGLVLIGSVQALVVLPDTFNHSNPHNSVYHGIFRITPTNTTNTSILIYYSSPFNITFKTTHIPILYTFYDNEFNLTIPEYFPSGVYRSWVYVVGENETIRMEITTNVTANKKLQSTPYINFTVNTGDNGYEFVTIKNTGNKILDLTTQIENSEIETITSYNSSFRILPNFQVDLPIVYSIPTNTQPKPYLFNITYNSNGVTNYTTVNIIVKDNIIPEIQEVIVPEEIKASTKTKIKVKSEDNIKISEVWAEWNNNTNFFNKRAIFYEADVVVFDSGVIDVEILCNDTSGNVKAITQRLNVEPYGGVEIHPIEYVQLKAGTEIEEKLFTSVEKIPVNITLTYEDFVGSVDTNETNTTDKKRMPYYEMSIDTNVGMFELEKDKSITLRSVDKMTYIFKTDQKGYFKFKLKFEMPEWVAENQVLDIQTKVSEFNIPRKHNIMIGNIPMRCDANMTNILSTSNWVCTTPYPITTDLSTIGRFMTQNEYDNVFRVIESERDVCKGALFQSRGETSFSLVLWIIFIIIMGLYIIISGSEYIFMMGGS